MDNVENEARKLKERIIDAINEFQRETDNKFNPVIDVYMIDSSTLNEKSYRLGNVTVRLESEY